MRRSSISSLLLSSLELSDTKVYEPYWLGAPRSLSLALSLLLTRCGCQLRRILPASEPLRISAKYLFFGKWRKKGCGLPPGEIADTSRRSCIERSPLRPPLERAEFRAGSSLRAS